MVIRVHTPRSIFQSIVIINDLRNNKNTKDVYAKVDGAAYAEYTRWFNEWDLICSNPVLMEENCLGGDEYKLDFSFMPGEAAIGLIKLYLTASCDWVTVTAVENDGKLQLTIEG